jgi:DNA-binding PadR family transcriptional regulator
MSLPHVLLGLLADRAATGYELARRLETEMDPLWRAEISQIYPALDGLRRSGFARSRVLGPDRGPRRHQFRITAAGRRELRRWVVSRASPPRAKDEGLSRMAFLDVLTLEERRRAVLNYDRQLAEEVRRLKAAGPLPHFRREARRVAIERLEATRRALKILAASAGTPVSVSPAPPEKKK